MTGTNFGTVALDVIDTHTVMVTETLAPGEVYAVTGAGVSLAFTVDKVFSVLAASLTSGFTVSTTGTSAAGFGAFGSYVDCTSLSVCGHGTSSPEFSGPLSFEVTSATGLSPSDFIANTPGGYFFASDIGQPKAGGGFNTGNVASNVVVSQLPPPPSVPEPSTWLLLVGGLALMAGRKRFPAR